LEDPDFVSPGMGKGHSVELKKLVNPIYADKMQYKPDQVCKEDSDEDLNTERGIESPNPFYNPKLLTTGGPFTSKFFNFITQKSQIKLLQTLKTYL